MILTYRVWTGTYVGRRQQRLERAEACVVVVITKQAPLSLASQASRAQTLYGMQYPFGVHGYGQEREDKEEEKEQEKT